MRWNDRIGRRIKLSDLHILLAVAQSGSMAKAANQLSVSHPVVSRSISDLEHVLGVPLLERSRRGIELTAYGRAMLNSGHAAFEELRQGVKNIEFLSDPTAGEVRIGTTSALAASFVTAVIERLVKRYPRIVYHVEVDSGDVRVEQRLQERRLDLLIYRNFPAVVEDQPSFEPLFQSPYVVAAGTKSPWMKRRRIELRDLASAMWVLPPPDPDNPFGSFVIDAFGACGLKVPRATVVSTGIEMRANLLRGGQYVSIFPEFWLQLPVRHPFVKKLPVELPVASGPIGIVTLKNRTSNPVVQRFMECAREVAKLLTRKNCSSC